MKWFLTILFLFVSLITSATDYYVKTAGSDSNTGLSDGQAWQTIDKVNATSLIGGDRVFFNRGDTFYGTLMINFSGSANNPIIYSAYGTGLAPVITAFTTLTAWTNVGGGIYSKAVYPTYGPDVNMVTVNGVNTPLGRWPDTGWNIIDNGYGGNTQFSAIDLPSFPSYTGGEVVIRKNAWIIDRNYISNHTGQLITYNSVSGYSPNDGTGYFIQKDMDALTSVGEWFYTAGVVYMYFGGYSPTIFTVKLSTLAQNIYIQGKNYITITGLTLEGANRSAVYISSSDYVTVQECRIQFAGDAGIDGGHNGGNSSLALSLINDTIEDVQNHGIYLETEFDGALIQGNVLNRIGLLPGMCFSGDGQNMGMRINGSNHIIEYNRLTNLGYLGIEFGGNNVKCRFNTVSVFCSVKDDGSGIYTASFNTMWTGREINNNIVLNGVGAAFNSMYGETNGIYADQRNSNLAIYGNTVFNCTNGIFLHNTHETQVYDNTLYANRDAQINFNHSSYDWPDDPIRNLEIENNLVLAKLRPAYAYRMEFHDQDNYFLFGTSDYNVICRFREETTPPDLIMRIHYTNYTLAQWKAISSPVQDANTTGNLGGTVTDTANLHFIYNDTKENQIYTLSAGMKDVRNDNYSGDIDLSPFKSLVLIGAGTVTLTGGGGIPSVLPTVQNFVNNITETTASAGGIVTDDGGDPVTDRGICWATTINPTIGGNHTHNGTGTGTFYQDITGLTLATTYYVRAFATNTNGTAYSANLIFTTTGISMTRFVKYLDELVKHNYKFIKIQ
jgi:parallel beta-helix repeat protein